MPSSLNLNGLRLYRPGIYAVIDASSLGGSGVSTGNVAVIGDFPLFEKAKPLTFATARALSEYSWGDAAMQQLGQLAFAPSVDDRVGGGAATLTVLNAGTSSQAQFPVRSNSDGGVPLLLFKSRVWGPLGNRVNIRIDGGADRLADSATVKVRANGETETLSISPNPLFSLQYTGDADACTAFFTPTETKIAWAFTSNLAADMDEVSLHQLVIDDQRCDDSTVSLSLSAAEEQDVVVKISGNNPLGQSIQETITISAGDTAAVGVSKFSRIHRAQVSTGADGSAGLTISAHSFNTTNSDFASLSHLTSLIDSDGDYTVVELSPRLGGMKASQVDCHSATAVDIKAAVTFTGNTQALIDAVNTSAFVTVDFPAGHNGRYDWSRQRTFTLYGGGETPSDQAGYQACFDAIVDKDIQIVVPMSEAVGVHQALVQHCKDAAIYGHERCGWVGVPANTSKADVFENFSRRINSRHVALCAQSIQVTAPDGLTPTLPPRFLALVLACMQAGTSVATPLTRKRPTVLDVIGTWNPSLEANEIIAKGICALSLDNLGWRVERSVTTYMTDDNPIYSEVSANESINTSVRNLRNRLDIMIGNPVVAGTAASIKGSAESALQEQVREGVIKAWRNLVLTDLGDRIDISYEVAAVEPLNFIKITANVVRIASNV